MELLRAETSISGGKVDFEAGVIRGMVLAEVGPFKTRRGRFDSSSLSAVVKSINGQSGGVPSHWGHPGPDGNTPHPYLGMVDNARLDGTKARGDLRFGKSAFDVPGLGNLANHVMLRVEDNARVISSSLALHAEVVHESNRGRPKLGDDGEPLPPLWKPTEILGSDIVGRGDAVNSLLSAGESPMVRLIRERYNIAFGDEVPERELAEIRLELRCEIDQAMAGFGFDITAFDKRRKEAIAKVDKILGIASN